MIHRIALAGIVACGACLLAACGGGGGSSGAGPSGTATLSADSTAIAAVATYSDDAPRHSLVLTVTKVPRDGLYVGYLVEGSAVNLVDFQQVSDTAAQLNVTLLSPLDLEVGTTTDNIEVHVCYDEACDREVRGSPLDIEVAYTISAPMTVSMSTTSVAATAHVLDVSGPSGTAQITVTNPSVRVPNILATPTSAGDTLGPVDVVYWNLLSASSIELDINFRPPWQMEEGVHRGGVSVRVCYDSNCRREVSGSPLSLATSYTVSNDALPEPALQPLPHVSRTLLTHDVVDAEYSAALDAIVIASATPRRSLYVYPMLGGAVRELPLFQRPISVSVAPDGLSVAVGHDALITWVDLTVAPGQPGARKTLAVSTMVYDLMLDGRGYVHALPAADQWVQVHSVSVADNVESLGSGTIRAGSNGRLHPSGDYFYTADNGLIPSDIQKHDIRTGRALYVRDSPYHGDYAMCGDLWMKEDGTRIYTKCGNVFQASTVTGDDMRYAGSLELSTASAGFHIVSLSQSDEAHQIALIETARSDCQDFVAPGRCFSHVAYYDSDTRNRTAVYTLPPIQSGGSYYTQLGLFIFHSADGQRQYSISRLHRNRDSGVPREYFLTEVQATNVSGTGGGLVITQATVP